MYARTVASSIWGLDGSARPERDHSNMPHSGPGVILRIAIAVVGNSLGVGKGNSEASAHSFQLQGITLAT